MRVRKRTKHTCEICAVTCQEPQRSAWCCESFRAASRRAEWEKATEAWELRHIPRRRDLLPLEIVIPNSAPARAVGYRLTRPTTRGSGLLYFPEADTFSLDPFQSPIVSRPGWYRVAWYSDDDQFLGDGPELAIAEPEHVNRRARGGLRLAVQ